MQRDEVVPWSMAATYWVMRTSGIGERTRLYSRRSHASRLPPNDPAGLRIRRDVDVVEVGQVRRRGVARPFVRSAFADSQFRRLAGLEHQHHLGRTGVGADDH